LCAASIDWGSAISVALGSAARLAGWLSGWLAASWPLAPVERPLHHDSFNSDGRPPLQVDTWAGRASGRSKAGGHASGRIGSACRLATGGHCSKWAAELRPPAFAPLSQAAGKTQRRLPIISVTPDQLGARLAPTAIVSRCSRLGGGGGGGSGRMGRARGRELETRRDVVVVPSGQAACLVHNCKPSGAELGSAGRYCC